MQDIQTPVGPQIQDAAQAEKSLSALNTIAAEQAHGSYAVVEQRLREAEELFKGLFDEAPVACHELDREGRVIRVNQAECKLMGFSAAEMLGRYVWEFTGDERKLSE